MGTHLGPGDVVVGVDGSAASIAALRWAADAAVRHDRQLRLLHAFTWPAYAAAYGLPPEAWANDAVREGAEATLEQAAAQAHEFAPDLVVHAEIQVGSPASVLTEASRHAPMVVLGSRGSGGFAELLLGSVSSQVSRHGAGAIVVVPEERDPIAPDRPRVVVGTDGSPAADVALRFAFEEAAACSALLTVVRAWRPPHPGWRDGLRPLTASRDEAETADLEAAEAQALGESAGPWQDKYPTVTVEHQLVAGHPAQALTASAHGALLLVVGSRGHGGFGGLHLGSVSQQVLQHAPCPVAVVRPQHHERADTEA